MRKIAIIVCFLLLVVTNCVTIYFMKPNNITTVIKTETAAKTEAKVEAKQEPAPAPTPVVKQDSVPPVVIVPAAAPVVVEEKIVVREVPVVVTEPTYTRYYVVPAPPKRPIVVDFDFNFGSSHHRHHR